MGCSHTSNENDGSRRNAHIWSPIHPPRLRNLQGIGIPLTSTTHLYESIHPVDMARRRPLGVTILGGLAVVGGIILLVLSLISLLAFFAMIGLEVDPEISGEAFLISAVINLIVGLVLLGSGRGLLNLRPWAWWLAFLIAIVGVLRSVFALVTGVAQAALSALASSLVGLVLLLVFLGYILSVKKHFR